MQKFSFKNLTFNKAIGLSVIFHSLLALLLFFIHTQMVMPSPEYAEISFMASSSRNVPVYKPVQQPEPNQPAPIIEKQEPIQPEPVIENEKTEPVNLPKFRNRLEEETEFIKRDYGKIDPSSSTQKINPDNSVYDQRAIAPADNNERNYYPTPSNNPTDTNPSMVEREGLTPGESDQAFTIEGEAAKRTLVKKVIPQYPPGLQKEAVVKIRITVLPNGQIGQMIPVLKGDPVLEEITLKSLREWKFNPLTPGDLKNVQGIVTFKYELR